MRDTSSMESPSVGLIDTPPKQTDLLEPRLGSLLDRAQEIPESAGCGLVLVCRSVVRPVSGRHIAGRLDQLQMRLMQGPVLDACEQGTRAAAALDLRNDSRWPRLGRELTDVVEPLSAVCLSVIPAAGQSLVLTWYGWRSQPGSLHLATEQLTSAAYRYLRTYAQDTAEMLASRRHIEQAKGVVMAIAGRSAAEAFDILRRTSQHYNVKLRELAIAVLELVGDGPAEAPQAIAPGSYREPPVPREQARQAAEHLVAILRGG